MKLKRVVGLALVITMLFSLFSGMPFFSEEPLTQTGVNAIDTDDYRGLVISKVYGNGAKKESVTQYGFIELCNTTDKPINMDGLALYYYSKTEGGADYSVFEFGSDTVIEAGAFYLIKCAGYKKSDTEVIKLTDRDAEWKVTLDNKEICLILAGAGRELDVSAQPAEIEDTISYFCATEEFYFDSSYLIGDISKSKYAVRTALKEDSGWYDVNLTKVSSAKLEQIIPMCSKGPAGEIVSCPVNEVKFNYPAGIYEDAIDVTLTAADGYTVYYTTDGSDPSVSATRRIYTGALHLTDTTHLGPGATTSYVAGIMGQSYYPTALNLPGARVIKAYATDGTNSTDVFTNTYFISAEAKTYGVTIMSISMDKSDFANGKTMAQALDTASGFYNHYFTTTNDSNPRTLGTLEVFDRGGERQGYSNVQFAINGHGSAGYGMKSMKIYFKKDFNQTGGRETKLNYDLFEGRAKNSKGQAITTFSKLLLRNSGNDFPYTMLRDAYQQRASSVMDIDTTASTTVLVFLNGEFWGVYNARERYCQDYVEAHYGVTDDNVVLLENDYTKVRTDWNAPIIVNDGEDGDADDFNNLVAYVKSHDMANQTYFDTAAVQLDLESLADMFIAHLYLNALDWPENNLKIWRNKVGDEDPSGVDTKWHFVLHDMDFGVACENDKGVSDPDRVYFQFLDPSQHNCTMTNLMAGLLRNQAFKDWFIARMYKAVREIYDPARMNEILDEMVAERTPLMSLQVGRWRQSDIAGNTLTAYNNGVSAIYNFINSRQLIFVKSMCSYFGITEAELMQMCGYGSEAEPIIPPYQYSFIGASYDTLSLHINSSWIALNSSGNASQWIAANIPNNTISSAYGADQLRFYGWIGFTDPIEAFGYQIDDNEPVWNPGFFFATTEDAVKYPQNGGQYARRFQIDVPISGLTGIHKVVAVVKVNGTTIKIDGTLTNTNSALVSPNTEILVGDPLPDEPDPEPGTSDYHFKNGSFDSFFLYINDNWVRMNNPDGNAPVWFNTNLPSRTIDRSLNATYICFYGWLGFEEDIESFGYQIDDNDPVLHDVFTETATGAVLYAENGGTHAKRFRISLPIYALTGNHTVVCVAKVNGCIVKLDSTLINSNGIIPSPDTTIIIDNSIKTHTSYDELRVNDSILVSKFGNNPNPTVVDLSDYQNQELIVYGWHSNNAVPGIYGTDFVFGYRIDDGEIFYSDEFLFATEQAVINAGKDSVGVNAVSHRFKIRVPITQGTHKIEAICGTVGVPAGQNLEFPIWTIYYTTDGPAEPAVLNSLSSTLNGKVSMNALLELPDFIIKDSGAYMKFTKDGVEKKVMVSDVLDSRSVTDDGTVLYKFSYEIVAKEFRDKVNFRLYDGNDRPIRFVSVSGNDFGVNGYDWALSDYLENRLEYSSNPKMRTLAAAMLDYGTAAQIYFNYNITPALGVSEAVREVQYSEFDQYAAVTDGTYPEGFTGNLFSLVLEGDTSLKMYFQFDSEHDPVNDYKYFVDGSSADIQVTSDGQYYLIVRNIAAKALDREHRFTITDGVNTYTISCSALTYARVLAASQNQANQDLGNAILLYNTAAKDYFGV